MVLAQLATAAQTVRHASGPLHLPAAAYVLIGSLLVLLGCAATLRPIGDPQRVLIFRLATLHRVSGPGYVFVLPFIDRIDTLLDMGEFESAVAIHEARTADGKRIGARLEVTWRVDPAVRGRPSRQIRATLLLSDERRVKLVEETVIGAARESLGQYTRADLTHAGARESAMRTTQFLANDMLAPRGLQVDRVFWRS